MHLSSNRNRRQTTKIIQSTCKIQLHLLNAALNSGSMYKVLDGVYFLCPCMVNVAKLHNKYSSSYQRN